jgi:hypothetical protein
VVVSSRINCYLFLSLNLTNEECCINNIETSGFSQWQIQDFLCIVSRVDMVSLWGQSQWGFHECFIHIKYSATSAKFHFLHETLRREKERVSPWWNLWAQFHMRWRLCETPIETQIEFHHATMQLNHTMRERLWDPWAYETVQWNYWGRHLFHTKVSHLGNRDGETLHWDWSEETISMTFALFPH